MQTNNASFGVSDESTQQLAMSRMRAIEHGRATVQISTVGVSAVIEPNGVVSQQTDLFTAEQMVASLPLRDSLTPATRLGSWPAWIIDALAVVHGRSPVSAGARRAASRRPDRDRRMTEPRGRVLVVVPTYNERENLPGRARRGCARTSRTRDVLVVDDGSPDGTGELAEKIAERRPTTTAPGGSTSCTARASSASAPPTSRASAGRSSAATTSSCEMDADGSHRAEDLPRLLAALARRRPRARLALGAGRHGRELAVEPARPVPRGEHLHAPRARHPAAATRPAASAPTAPTLLRDADARRHRVAGLLLPGRHGVARRARQGARVAEVPITFVERELGTSKMSRAIVVEALVSVTRWGIAERSRRVAGAFRRSQG